MSDNWKIQVSPKIGNTLVNVRAESVEELRGLLVEFQMNVLDYVKGIEGIPTGTPAPIAAPVVASTPTPAFAPATNSDARTCKHGAMTYKTGVGKTGAPWKAYMCNAPKDASDKCDPQWIR